MNIQYHPGEGSLRKTIGCIMIMVCCVACSVHTLYAQDKEKADEYVRQQEQAKKAALMRELDSGVYFMDNGDYKRADKIFRHVLSSVKSVPSDLTYYFGKNSFYMEQYKQSIDWLNKYIQLKGTNGQYSQDAILWKQRAEAEFLKEKSTQAEKVQQVLSMDYDIDCGPAGKVVCPACKGDHVIIHRGAFGNEYKTCPYCNEQGILTCEEYNLLIRGKLQAKTVNR
jgi:tetratricopeptide (TPR) repeat protein